MQRAFAADAANPAAHVRDFLDLDLLLGCEDPDAVAGLFRRKATHRGLNPATFAEAFERRVREYKKHWEQELEQYLGEVPHFDEVERSVLGVDEKVLTNEGAVSEPVVRQMALGAMQRSGAQYAIAVSGIAGPDGGTPDKPVGTVWLAWGSRDDLRSCCLRWPVERTLFQTMVAAASLDMIRRLLLGQ